MTFEPDALYWKERGTYLGAFRAWNSNMPEDYKDTERSENNPDVRTVAVGSSNGQKFRANKPYYTFMSFANGGQDTDGAGLNHQQGRRVPLWCHNSTWCVFSSGTDRIIYLNDYRVPGSASYYSQEN